MNCQSCNARVDYYFLTSCAHCNSKIDASGVPQIDPFPEPHFAKRRVWIATVVNIAYMIASSMAGMISGIVSAYFLGVVVYQIFFRASESAHSGCGGPGMAIALLSIFSGAYLGIMGGTVFAIRRPLCKS